MGPIQTPKLGPHIPAPSYVFLMVNQAAPKSFLRNIIHLLPKQAMGLARTQGTQTLNAALK